MQVVNTETELVPVSMRDIQRRLIIIHRKLSYVVPDNPDEA